MDTVFVFRMTTAGTMLLSFASLCQDRKGHAGNPNPNPKAADQLVICQRATASRS